MSGEARCPEGDVPGGATGRGAVMDPGEAVELDGATEPDGAKEPGEATGHGGAVLPAEAAEPVVVAREGALSRVASMAATVWNVVCLSVYIVLVVGAVLAIVSPNARDAALPLWFRMLEYGGITIVAPSALVYLLLVKRRLRERIPALTGVSRLRETAFALAIACAGVAVPLIVGSLSGLI